MRFFSLLFFLSILQASHAQEAGIQLFGQPESISRLNSPYDENFISLHPGGEQIVVTRRNHPRNIGDRHNPGDLWLSQFDSAWSQPININVHPTKLVTPLGFVNQGEVLLYSTTFFDKGIFRGEIWISDLQDQTLTNQRKLDISNFINLSEHQSGAISGDGKHILFSMEGNFTYGVEDLYVSHLGPDGKWSTPRNLGYRINTAFQEYTPFLAADNETLIFASNGRKDGFGSFDLYASQRIDNTWQNWTEPVNLGATINTNGAEMSFVFLPGSDFAYFSSTTDSDGYGDIKRIRITSDIEEVVDQPVVFEMKEEEITTSEKFFVLVDDNSNPIEGEMLLIGERETISLKSGESFVREEYEDLVIETRAEGFLNHVTNVTASEINEMDTIYVSVEALEVGNTINLEHVLFYRGTANFIEGSEAELDQVADMLMENPGISILLKGHTDNQGDPILNVQLSEERVKTVQNYLLSKGIKLRRIQGKGYGGNDPIAPNDTEDNRRLNRRVEFTIVEKN